ncbi:MAG: hypothetical protein ACI8S6_003291 [Myxococcota bacterium]|jgi:hypothetical protein
MPLILAALLACTGISEPPEAAPSPPPPPSDPVVTPGSCRAGLFAAAPGPYRLAEVRPEHAQLHFRSDDQGCPTAESCILTPYIIPGDQVIISGTTGNHQCAWYTASSGKVTVGWLPTAALSPITSEPSPWEGTWGYGSNDLRISSPQPGTLQVSGTALWHGLGDNIHIGELAESQGRLSDGILRLSPYDGCAVTIRRLGPWLIVDDNLGCGGLNVTFRGVYRRT